MFKTANLDSFNRRLRRTASAMKESGFKTQKKVNFTLIKGAGVIRDVAVRSMRNTQRASHSYKRGNKKHFPSKPGSAPAIDRGNLVGSILFDVSGGMMQVGSILNKPPYPKWLEEGTSKMEARPWLRPSVDKVKKPLINELGKIVPDIIGDVFKRTQF